MTMKKIFIATLAVLAFAGCNNEKKAENVAEANATETVATVSSSDIAVVDVIFVVNERSSQRRTRIFRRRCSSLPRSTRRA